MEESKKRNLSILALILSILQFLFLFWINKDYKGIYEVEVFIPALMVLFLFFLKLVLGKTNVNNKRFIFLLIILISIPIFIYISLPKYNFQQAKNLLKADLEGDKDIKFIDKELNTIDVKRKKKKLFIRDKSYYFALTIDGADEEFIVDPLNGRINKLID